MTEETIVTVGPLRLWLDDLNDRHARVRVFDAGPGAREVDGALAGQLTLAVDSWHALRDRPLLRAAAGNLNPGELADELAHYALDARLGGDGLDEHEEAQRAPFGFRRWRELALEELTAELLGTLTGATLEPYVYDAAEEAQVAEEVRAELELDRRREELRP